MSKKNKIIIFIFLVAVLLLLVFMITPKALSAWQWRRTAEAAGGLPYQIGLTKAVITECVTTGTPPTCVGAGIPPDPVATPLCNTKGPAICTAYSVVSGVPAGGMGTNALFSNAAIAKAGLTPGGQLIAGGMSPAFMDQGVLVSAGGCFGCVAENGLASKVITWLGKWINLL